MKICDKCGAYNSDNRQFCIDCGDKLGDPVSDRERQRAEQSIDANMEKLYNDNDPLHITLFDKICGAAALAGAVAGIPVWIFGLLSSKEPVFPLYALVFLLLSAVEAFFPALTWGIEKFRLSFTVDNVEDATPSPLYKWCRKASILLCLGIGLLLMAEMIIELI